MFDYNLTGWLDGLLPIAIFSSALIFGILSIISGARKRAKLLTIAGLQVITIGSYYLGPIVEFLFYGFTGVHLDGVLYFYLSYSQIWLGVITIAILGAEVLTPNYKGAVVGAMTALGLLHFALLYTGIFALLYEIPYIDVFGPPFTALGPYAPWIPYILYPAPPGGIIDASYNPANPAFALIIIFQGFNLIFISFGFLVKAKQSSGRLRGQFILVSIAFVVFFVSLLDAIYGNPLTKTIVRISMLSFGPLLYLGFRP